MAEGVPAIPALGTGSQHLGKQPPAKETPQDEADDGSNADHSRQGTVVLAHVARLSSVGTMTRTLQRGPENSHIAKGKPNLFSIRVTKTLLSYA